MEKQDVLTFKPERVKIVRDPKILKILYDENHGPIIRALRKGPMTVKELEEAYAKDAKINEELEAKSDKTIYRYLKVLEKANLVVPAGQRVILGKTATETLFARTAEAFLSGEKEKDHWQTEKGKIMAKSIARLLAKGYGDRKVNVECLQKFMGAYDSESNKQIIDIIESADESLLEHFTSIDWKYKNKVLYYLGLFSIVLNNPRLLEKLSKCFKETG